MSIHVAVVLVPVKCFDHKGLHQLQKVVIDERSPWSKRFTGTRSTAT